MSDTLEDTIEYILGHKLTNPDGRHAKQLRVILARIKNNVFVGPRTMKYVNDCLSALDNVECNGLAQDGTCLFIPSMGQCRHKKRYDKCHGYERPKPNYKGSPIKIGESK